MNFGYVTVNEVNSNVWKLFYSLCVPLTTLIPRSSIILQICVILGHSCFPSGRRQTPTWMVLIFSTDQSVYLFQDSFVFYGFYRVGAFASVTGHHCCQTGIFRIILKEISSVLKCCQASNSGAYIIRMNTRQNSYLFIFFSIYSRPESKIFLTLACQYSNIRNPLIYYVNCYFLMLTSPKLQSLIVQARTTF